MLWYQTNLPRGPNTSKEATLSWNVFVNRDIWTMSYNTCITIRVVKVNSSDLLGVIYFAESQWLYIIWYITTLHFPGVFFYLMTVHKTIDDKNSIAFHIQKKFQWCHLLNGRENRRSNQGWTIKRHRQHSAQVTERRYNNNNKTQDTRTPPKRGSEAKSINNITLLIWVIYIYMILSLYGDTVGIN